MKNVIAIDIGGTKTLGAVFNYSGELLKQHRIATNPKKGPSALINSLISLIEELKTDIEVGCIAIGSAGRINTVEGSVFYASDNIPGWTGVQLKKIVEEKFNIHTIVENDCKVTGLGEEWKGSAKGLKSYVCIALGTGIGAAIKCEGILLHGAHWSAGELGHVILYPNGRQCNCGLKGCFEQYCSGTALVKLYNEISNFKIETGYDFFDLVEKKEENALKVLDEFCFNLATAILSFINSYDPQKIIIGGGLIDTKNYWWDKMISNINKSSISKLFTPIIEPAMLKSEAAIYGAAYLGLQYLKNKH